MQFNEIVDKLKANFKIFELPHGIIVNADCFKVLPLIPKSAYCIVNDMPWFNSPSSTNNAGTSKASFHTRSEENLQEVKERQSIILESWKVPEPRKMAFQMKNVLVKGGVIWLFGMQPYLSDYHIVMEQKGFKFMQEIIWGKLDRPSMGDGRYCLRAHANIFQYRFNDIKLEDTHYDIKKVCINPEGQEEIRLKGKEAGSHLKGKLQPVASRLKWSGEEELVYRKNVGYPRSIIEAGVVKENDPQYVGHPSQIPISLVEMLVKMSTEEGDLVIDPFSGSGTTASVCEKLNRKYIVIEITEEWAKKGYERVLRDIGQFKEEQKYSTPSLMDFEDEAIHK